jgi:hypothetical protein
LEGRPVDLPLAVLVMQVEQGAELGTQMNKDMGCSVPWSRKCNLPCQPEETDYCKSFTHALSWAEDHLIEPNRRTSQKRLFQIPVLSSHCLFFWHMEASP